MHENSLLSLLESSFPKSDKEIWKKIASKEAEGKDPFEILQWQSSDGLHFLPYYDISDLDKIEIPAEFRLTNKSNSFLGARTWINTPNVSVADEKSANKISLEHLQNGADGVFYSLNRSINLEELLRDIEWPYCSIFFGGANDEFIRAQLIPFVAKNKLDSQNINGALFWESIPKKDVTDSLLKALPKLFTLGLKIPPSTPVKEIVFALTQGVRSVDNANLSGDALHHYFKSIAFSIGIGNNFLESIAKLKALRMLWYQISQAYQVENYQPADLFIHASSYSWINDSFEPHGNMLKGTTSGMAAIIGGCDALTVYPQDENNNTQMRIARNVSNILREESHMNKVADPLAGAYVVDVITTQLSQAAWKEFQSQISL